MLKTRLIILLLMVGVFMFLGATAVMAADLPRSCMAGSYTITLEPNAPLTINSRTDPNFDNYPCNTCDFPYYVFQYNISPTMNISRIGELLPVCKNPINVLATNTLSQVLPPGTPDPKFKYWPYGIYDGFELAWTSNPFPSNGNFWVATNTSGISLNSMAVGAGSSLLFCQGGIAGPDCGVPGFVPLSSAVRLKLGPGEVCITKDTNGCITDVTDCDEYHFPLTPIDIHSFDSESVQYAGSETSGGQCATTILVTQGSPTCYPIISGGYATKVCYCQNNSDCASVGFRSCVSGKCR
jgi:hypothetical protein